MLLIILLGLIAKLGLVSGGCDVGTLQLNDFDCTKAEIVSGQNTYTSGPLAASPALHYGSYEFSTHSEGCVTANNGWKYRQCCANRRFRIVGLKDLDIISLIDVYERLIHAAIQ